MGALALQGAVVLVGAGLVEMGVRSARWRRAAWLAALVGLGLVLANSVTGFDRAVAGWFAAQPQSGWQFTVRGNLPIEASRSLRSDSKRSERRVLFVFVTATLIDAAGNPLHAADTRAPDPARAPAL